LIQLILKFGNTLKTCSPPSIIDNKQLPTIPTHILAEEVGKFLTWSKPIDGAIFVFGGRSGRLGDARQYLKSAEYLDPTTLTWRRAPDMNYARVGLAAAYLDGYYYVIGGYNQVNGDPQHSVERLCVDTLTWKSCSSLLIPRYGHSACACDGRIYVMGGDHGGVLVPFAERYDPQTDAWERIPDMPIRVAAARATCIGGKIFLFGGCDPSVPGDRASDAILMFDPSIMRWTILAKRMETGRTAFCLAPLSKGVVIAGGFDLSSRPEVEMTSVEIIDDLVGQTDHEKLSHSVTPLPLPRAGCQGVSISTKNFPSEFQHASTMPVIVLGGEYIDPATGSCKVYDHATMLVNREFSDERDRSGSCGSGLTPFSAGKAIINALKRRRRQSSFDSTSSAMVWSDFIIPPMSKKRTAFAACVGTVWPKGHKTIPSDRIEGDMIDEGSTTIGHQRRDSRRSVWPDLLHEWLQGNVL
jgi:hypothetical protein